MGIVFWCFSTLHTGICYTFIGTFNYYCEQLLTFDFLPGTLEAALFFYFLVQQWINFTEILYYYTLNIILFARYFLLESLIKLFRSKADGGRLYCVCIYANNRGSHNSCSFQFILYAQTRFASKLCFLLNRMMYTVLALVNCIYGVQFGISNSESCDILVSFPDHQFQHPQVILSSAAFSQQGLCISQKHWHNSGVLPVNPVLPLGQALIQHFQG